MDEQLPQEKEIKFKKLSSNYVLWLKRQRNNLFKGDLASETTKKYYLMKTLAQTWTYPKQCSFFSWVWRNNLKFQSLQYLSLCIPDMNTDRITVWVRLAGSSGDCLIHLPISGQGHLQQVAQGNVLLSVEYLQGYRLQSLSGNLFRCLIASVKRSFSLSLNGTLCILICLLPLILPLVPMRRVYLQL